MRHTSPRLVLLSAVLLAACHSQPPAVPASAEAAPAGVLQVDGATLTPGTLTRTDLESLGAEDVAWTFRDVPHRYRAVPLDRLLTARGFEPGAGGKDVPPRDRRPGWRVVLRADGSDGFFAVFTVAELMPQQGPSRVYVAFARDGAPLPADEGPLRLVVPTDRSGSRSVRQLTRLQAIDLRTWSDR
jgi:DMSO/TMAO reductase YedYZ molybdopterin-dependent catalytic subunit